MKEITLLSHDVQNVVFKLTYYVYMYFCRRNDCIYHGEYRNYRDKLNRYKSWCILWVTIAIVPLGMAVKASGIDLNWAMLFGFIITLPCFPPVVLATFWSKTSGPGVITGDLI